MQRHFNRLRLLRFLCGLLMCSMLLCAMPGCKSSDLIPKFGGEKQGVSDDHSSTDDTQQGGIVTMSPYCSYSKKTLENPAHYALGESIDDLFYFDGDVLCVPTGNYSYSGEIGTTILRYDRDGALLSADRVPGDISGSIRIRALSDGRYLFLCLDPTTDHKALKLTMTDAQGNVTSDVTVTEFDLSAIKSGERELIDWCVTDTEDGLQILVCTSTTAYAYDGALNCGAAVALPNEYTGIHRESDGVYWLGNALPRICRIDTNASTLTPITDLPVAPRMKYFCTVQFGADGKMYCNYDGSVYLCDGTGGMTELLRWNHGYYDGNGKLMILDESSFYYRPMSYVSESFTDLVHLQPVTDTLSEQRDVITLVNNSGYNEEWLRDVIGTFNAENESYFVELIDLTSGEGTTESRWNGYLLNNGMPDMVQFSGSRDAVRSLADKGLLQNLAADYGDRLYGCARLASSDGSELFAVPLSMTMQLFCADTAVCSDVLTWEQLYALAMEIDILNTVDQSNVYALTTSNDVLDILRNYMLMDYVDFETGEATFTDDSFRRRIEFLSYAKQTLVAEDYGALGFGINRYCLLRSAVIKDAIRDGRVALLSVPFHSVEAYAVLKMMFDGNSFSLCGYPTADGTRPGAAVYSLNNFAVSADTDNRDGCYALLDFLLSDAIQSSVYLISTSLPVTRSGMALALDNSRYCYYTAAGAADMDKIFFLPEGHYPNRNDHLANSCIEVEITEQEREMLLAFFDTCYGRSTYNGVVTDIAWEELSAYESGAKTLDEVSKLIQSRVSIYLAERQ